jgi:hypothetical protein
MYGDAGWRSHCHGSQADLSAPTLVIYIFISMESLAGGLTVRVVKLILALRRRLRRATPSYGRHRAPCKRLTYTL